MRNLQRDAVVVPGAQEEETRFCRFKRQHDDAIFLRITRTGRIRFNAMKLIHVTCRTRQYKSK